MIIIPNILDDKQLDGLIHAMLGAKMIDGVTSAGRAAMLVKKNTQVAHDDEMLVEMQQLVAGALMQHEIFQAYARPKTIIDIVFSRYDEGQEYGSHVDNAVMKNHRTDLAFTITLSDGYKGGSLAIEDKQLAPGRDLPKWPQDANESWHKLAPGDVIIYPATSLHRVTRIEAGYRLAAVGWIESFVRSHEHREILYELETVRAKMFEQSGKTREFDQLSKATQNLARMWLGL